MWNEINLNGSRSDPDSNCEYMDFAGESLVVSPDGAVLEKADDKEQIVYVELELEKAASI